MALNWIPKVERMPTADDANSKGLVYAYSPERISTFHYTNLYTGCYPDLTHWLPFREMPTPERWRTPTINDLAKAGQPIPCRVRVVETDPWQSAMLMGFAFWDDRFFADATFWKYCEIRDE